ncbi:hypothetical protein KKI24_17405, partial [bacterium]|nr:hypothetical protein [bacterium]
REKWGRKSYYSPINLNRFSRRESLLMMAHFLKTETVERELAELVLGKTEGIPFFIEEFIQSLIDLKIVRKQDGQYRLSEDSEMKGIPASISDVIMARVDSLPEQAREVLQVGAVIEREFSFRILRQITGFTDSELEAVIDVIKDSELVYERGITPDNSYIFNHSLTREVIYDTILTTRKQKLHEQVGSAIETLYPEELQKYYEILGEHFSICGDFIKGDNYLILACRKAEKTAALDVALELGLKRVAFLEKLPASREVQTKIIDARAAVGLYYIQFNRHVEAKEVVEPVIELAKSYGLQKRLAQIYIILGSYYFFIEEDFDKALSFSEASVNISKEINHIPTIHFAYYYRSLVHSYSCQFETAHEYLNASIKIVLAKKDIWGVSMMKSNLSIQCLDFYGKSKQAFDSSAEGLKMADECGDAYSKAMAYTAHGFSCLCSGFLEKASELIRKGIEFCEKAKIFLWAANAYSRLTDVCFYMGEYQQAVLYARQAIARLGELKLFPSFLIQAKIDLIRADVLNEQKVFDLKQSIDLVHGIRMKCMEGRGRRSLATALLNLQEPQFSDATGWIESAIDHDRRNGMPNSLGLDHAFYSQVLKRQDKLPQAREQMEKAIDIMKTCGAEGWVERYEKELTEP